jgi:hypothetical protein
VETRFEERGRKSWNDSGAMRGNSTGESSVLDDTREMVQFDVTRENIAIAIWPSGTTHFSLTLPLSSHRAMPPPPPFQAFSSLSLWEDGEPGVITIVSPNHGTPFSSRIAKLYRQVASPNVVSSRCCSHLTYKTRVSYRQIRATSPNARRACITA